MGDHDAPGPELPLRPDLMYTSNHRGLVCSYWRLLSEKLFATGEEEAQIIDVEEGDSFDLGGAQL